MESIGSRSGFGQECSRVRVRVRLLVRVKKKCFVKKASMKIMGPNEIVRIAKL